MAVVVFGVAVLLISVVNASARTTSQNYQIAPVGTSPVEETTSAAVQKVDYFLAYPGILPDHFLYPIKMIRDRIRLLLTTESLRKAETLLLFADKRLGAGKALIEGGKEQLGISTLTKAEKYLERAIAQERIVKEKGKDTSAFLEKLSLATKKHEEVLIGLQEKVGETGRGAIEEILRYPRQGYEEVRQRLGK